MRTINIRINNHQVQRFSVEQLLNQIEEALPNEATQPEQEVGVRVPLSQRLVSVERRNGNFIYKFNVKLENFNVKISPNSFQSRVPEWLRERTSHRTHDNVVFLPITEREGIEMQYLDENNGLRLSAQNLKVYTRNLILPNIYPGRYLCFGRNNARPVDGEGDILKEVETAITIFLSGVFNSDLCVLEGEAETFKQRIINFFRENPTPHLDIQHLEGTEGRYFKEKLFHLALAHVTQTDISKLTNVLLGRS